MAQRQPNKHRKSVVRLDKAATASNKKMSAKAKIALPTGASGRAVLKSNEARKSVKNTKTKDLNEGRVSRKRISFIVRITVDEQQQIHRTEIEHVESRRKENFLNLEDKQLVAFMKAHITPTLLTPRVPARLSSRSADIPISIPPRPKSHQIISSIQVFRLKNANFATLILTTREPFLVGIQFQIEEPQSNSVGIQGSSYEIKVYANKIINGKAGLLATYSAKLNPYVLQYFTLVTMPGLPPGFYRLFTLITLGNPVKQAGYCDGPVIQVI